MRLTHVLAVVVALAAAAPASASSAMSFAPSFDGIDLRLPDFRLRSSLSAAPLTPFVPTAATPSIVLPPRYAFALDDGRAFWFAAGASSVVALGTHVLVGLPTFVISGNAIASAGGAAPAAQVPLFLGVSSAYVVGQSALSALAAMLVFNSVSKVYDGDYAVALSAHIAGTVLGAAVSALPFGTGFMLYGGLLSLGEFTGGAGVTAIAVFSVLGALPAVVIGGIALVGVPAIIGAWAMSVSAKTKPGFTIDPQWRDPNPVRGAAAPLITIPLG